VVRGAAAASALVVKKNGFFLLRENPLLADVRIAEDFGQLIVRH
jgi:hypothetical protein